MATHGANTLRGAIGTVRPASLVLAAGLVLAACGATAASSGTISGESETSRRRVIQDPENPASRLWADQVRERSGASVVRDPENPYWIGFTGSTDLDVPGNGQRRGPF